jgi:hypothetical protein
MKKIKLPSPETILIIGSCCILIAPILITRNFGLLSFKDTGPIGDTIGGITAPITGLIGSLLVYYALKAQIEANKLIVEQFEHQKTGDLYEKRLLYVSQRIDTLRSDINDFKFAVEKQADVIGRQKIPFEYSGLEGIKQSLEYYCSNSTCRIDREKERITHLIQIQIFLNAIVTLKRLINNSTLEDFDKQYLDSVLFNLYYLKLFPILSQFEEKRLAHTAECRACKTRHSGIPEYIYEKYDTINEIFKLTK